MKFHGLVLTGLAILALTACSGVFSVEPVGRDPLVLVPEEWEGTWSDSDDFLEIRIVDGESGRLEAAWIEAGEEGFELERVEVLVRRVGEAIFGNAIEEDEAVEGEAASGLRYAIFRIARDGDKIVLWWPGVEAFKAAVEVGSLPGEITDGGDVVLGKLGPEHLELLAGDESASLWEWQEPGVLFRPGRP